MAGHRRDLQEAVSYFYEACDLFEDGDLDRDDHLAVFQRAFLTYDCDDFAWMLSHITGWPPVRTEWENSGHGRGHHTLVKNPGRLVG